MSQHHALAVAFATSILASTSIAQDFPAGAIAGRWTADAQMSSSVSGGSRPGYWWVGKINASIERAGRVLVTAENGCRISGLAMPPARAKVFTDSPTSQIVPIQT